MEQAVNDSMLASVCYTAEEVRYCYALMNIPRTKTINTTIGNGLRGFRDAESVSPVRSNIACLCDLQTVFM